MGDCNDTSYIFKQGFSMIGKKVNPPAKLLSCCYEPGYGMQGNEYQFTGDYVMSTYKQRIGIVSPDGTLTKDVPQKEQIGRSDHDVAVQLEKNK